MIACFACLPEEDAVNPRAARVNYSSIARPRVVHWGHTRVGTAPDLSNRADRRR